MFLNDLKRTFVELGQALSWSATPKPMMIRQELFRFKTAEDISKWRVNTDQEFGGKSVAKIHLENEKAVFEGSLSLETKGTKMKKSGYAAMNSLVPYMDIGHLYGLELKIKTDGRPYVANLTISHTLNEKIFQAVICPSSIGQWTNVIIPFNDFKLTFLGKIMDTQTAVDLNRLIRFGILMADGNCDPFHFEIESVDIVPPVIKKRYNF